ncbi:DUF5000 domain-containing lipoprotein [Lunatibacter salilacus]|uniref:DUF5000 domain-containing lipoprotein n=1 Tax=Lunatibacter salilacus TaxID=2483804 RepID=UPI00131AB33A|nr:DUF5000 domain-containing lipoprotein [Lunatibacter salilacus]
MKNLIKKLIAGVLPFLLISCEEELNTPLILGGDAPGLVQEVEVQNLAGGARITYKVPADDNALFVEAQYVLDNGRKISTRSSIYKNFIDIEGLRESKSQEVQLSTVSRGNVASEPISVSIFPERAPIDILFDSFDLTEDFGGVRLVYNNDLEVKAEILLYKADQNGNMVYNQSAFIADDQRSHLTFRNFPPSSSGFGIRAIDRWDNITDIFESTVVPLEEIQLDRSLFRDISMQGDAGSAFGWVKTNMWNGSIAGSGFHTSQDNLGIVFAPYDEPYHAFTIDLGVDAKLSRFKFWQRRDGWEFRHGNPRYFDLWGTNELPADNGESLEGWFKLIENGEVIKPSGGPLGVNSAEDLAQATNGEEFECNIEVPAVRYIRFVNKESWSGAKFMHVMELGFWGQIEN